VHYEDSLFYSVRRNSVTLQFLKRRDDMYLCEALRRVCKTKVVSAVRTAVTLLPTCDGQL
jgi:hypothetical protein